MQIHGNFILGIPYKDGKWYPKADIITAKAISIIKPEICSISFFTPIPGSYLCEFCKNNDLILPTATLGLRFASEGKIKGVNYKFLNKLSVLAKHRIWSRFFSSIPVLSP